MNCVHLGHLAKFPIALSVCRVFLATMDTCMGRAIVFRVLRVCTPHHLALFSTSVLSARLAHTPMRLEVPSVSHAVLDFLQIRTGLGSAVSAIVERTRMRRGKVNVLSAPLDLTRQNMVHLNVKCVRLVCTKTAPNLSSASCVQVEHMLAPVGRPAQLA